MPPVYLRKYYIERVSAINTILLVHFVSLNVLDSQVARGQPKGGLLASIIVKYLESSNLWRGRFVEFAFYFRELFRGRSNAPCECVDITGTQKTLRRCTTIRNSSCVIASSRETRGISAGQRNRSWITASDDAAAFNNYSSFCEAPTVWRATTDLENPPQPMIYRCASVRDDAIAKNWFARMGRLSKRVEMWIFDLRFPLPNIL